MAKILTNNSDPVSQRKLCANTLLIFLFSVNFSKNESKPFILIPSERFN